MFKPRARLLREDVSPVNGLRARYVGDREAAVGRIKVGVKVQLPVAADECVCVSMGVLLDRCEDRVRGAASGEISQPHLVVTCGAFRGCQNESVAFSGDRDAVGSRPVPVGAEDKGVFGVRIGADMVQIDAPMVVLLA